MPFPSYLGASDLDGAWKTVREQAGVVKLAAQKLRSDTAVGSVTGTSIIDFAQQLADSRGRLAEAAAVPGIEAYARNQINDPTLDLAAEYTAMVTQINATIAWVRTNFPQDANNYLLYVKLDANGNRQLRTFDSASTAGLRTVLDSLIATIT